MEKKNPSLRSLLCAVINIPNITCVLTHFMLRVHYHAAQYARSRSPHCAMSMGMSQMPKNWTCVACRRANRSCKSVEENGRPDVRLTDAKPMPHCASAKKTRATTITQWYLKTKNNMRKTRWTTDLSGGERGDSHVELPLEAGPRIRVRCHCDKSSNRWRHLG